MRHRKQILKGLVEEREEKDLKGRMSGKDVYRLFMCLK